MANLGKMNDTQKIIIGMENKELKDLNIQLVSKLKEMKSIDIVDDKKKNLFLKKKEIDELSLQKKELLQKIENLQKKFQILKKIKDEDFTFSFEDEKERDEMYKALDDTLMTNNEQYHKYHQENKKLLSSILKIYENSSKK